MDIDKCGDGQKKGDGVVGCVKVGKGRRDAEHL